MKPWVVRVVVQDFDQVSDELAYFDDEAAQLDYAEYMVQAGFTCFLEKNPVLAKPPQAGE